MPQQGRLGRTLNELLKVFERAEALDKPGDALSGYVQAATRPDSVKSTLSGAFLGHALHPVVTDLPIGFWTSAILLDLVGGESSERAVDVLLIAGNTSAVAAAATGLADWSDAFGAPKRLGLVHALLNGGALTFFTAASATRLAGAKRAGTLLGLTGFTVATASAYLGGHLVYRRGLGVDHAGFESDEAVPEWQDVAAAAEITEGGATAATINGLNIFLTRDRGEIRAMVATCTHAGGPLNEGELSAGTVTCPWHGSRFSLADGCVLRGPAAMPQPVLQTRVTGERVEVRTQ